MILKMNKFIPDVKVFEAKELNNTSILERLWGLKIAAEGGFVFSSIGTKNAEHSVVSQNGWDVLYSLSRTESLTSTVELC